MKKLIIITLFFIGCDPPPSYPEPTDCAGVANGSSVLDDCDICTGIDNYVPGSCYDCAGNPNGDFVEDNCGVCDDDTSNNCVQDCAEVWGGNAVLDDCGICTGIEGYIADSCYDCAGNLNGNFVEDNCGVCDDDTSNDCVQDCADVWGGNAIEIWSQCYDLNQSLNYSIDIQNSDMDGTIPNEIGNFNNKLITLFAQENNLSGAIPNEIGNLTSLTKLWLYSNQLSGAIPSEIGNLTNLKQLTVSGNLLTSIPESFCNIKPNLELYVFVYNKICGELPSCLTEEEIGFQFCD